MQLRQHPSTLQLEGRADETLLLPSHGGIVEILPREIVEVFASLPSVEEFQLVQTGGRELDLRLALREGVDPAQGRLEAQARLATSCGERCPR